MDPRYSMTEVCMRNLAVAVVDVVVGIVVGRRHGSYGSREMAETDSDIGIVFRNQ